MPKKSRKPLPVSRSLKKILVREGVIRDIMLGINVCNYVYKGGKAKPPQGRSDHGLFFCTKCRSVWEYKQTSYKPKYHKDLLMYSEIPSYGKERKTCLNCQER